MTVIESKKRITRAQRDFQQRLKAISDIRVDRRVGFQGGVEQVEVYWSSRLRIWMGFDRADNRFWNPFGTMNPDTRSALHIVCEINFPFTGINRRVGGTFVEDDAGKVYVAHRGKIGGGRTGIGKELFLENYSGSLSTVIDGNRQEPLAVIARLDERSFPRKVARFVKEVERIKRLVS